MFSCYLGFLYFRLLKNINGVSYKFADLLLYKFIGFLELAELLLWQKGEHIYHVDFANCSVMLGIILCICHWKLNESIFVSGVMLFK
jgi:hypothetical protein